VTDRQKNTQTWPRSSAGSRPPLPKFSGNVEVGAHYIFHPSTIWVRPLFKELGPKNPPFAKKQTNICRLSGDITSRYMRLDSAPSANVVAMATKIGPLVVFPEGGPKHILCMWHTSIRSYIRSIRSLRQARLLLGWVTVCGQVHHLGM